MAERYDTLVVRGSTSQTVPREAAGGELVAWANGHSLAEMWPLQNFVQELADGCYEGDDIDTIQAKANQVLDLSRHQRDQGWVKAGEKNA